MKQFQYVSSRTGATFGPYDEDQVREMDRRVHRVLTLSPGSTWTDHENDVWSRVDGAANPAERLERIATAVLAGLASVPNSSLQLTPDDVRRLDVASALKYAKALIAELDKQA